MRILIVEDDTLQSAHFLDLLSKKKYLVDVAKDSLNGLHTLQTIEYDLVILDVRQTGIDGRLFCHQLRDRGLLVPVLITADLNYREVAIEHLQAGADDYLLKPMYLPELYARIQALIRRGKGQFTASILQVGDLCLHPHACEVTYLGKPLLLKPIEFSILELFMRHPQRFFSHPVLLEQLWQQGQDLLNELTVKSHIKSLRQRLKAIDMDDLIEIVYGVGYRINNHYVKIAKDSK